MIDLPPEKKADISASKSFKSVICSGFCENLRSGAKMSQTTNFDPSREDFNDRDDALSEKIRVAEHVLASMPMYLEEDARHPHWTSDPRGNAIFSRQDATVPEGRNGKRRAGEKLVDMVKNKKKEKFRARGGGGEWGLACSHVETRLISRHSKGQERTGWLLEVRVKGQGSL